MTETNRIELKRELTDELDIEKEVIAFLNNREGGIIYVGIDKDGSVVGVKDIDGDMLKIKDRIRKNISPSPMVMKVMQVYDRSCFTFMPNFTRITIKNFNATENVALNVAIELTERQQNILDLIIRNVALNVALNTTMISEALDVDRKTVQRDLKVLLDNQLIMREGGNKLGHWVVAKSLVKPVKTLVIANRNVQLNDGENNQLDTENKPISKQATTQVTPQPTPPVTPPATPQVEGLLAALKNEELTRNELMDRLKITDVKYFKTDYLQPALRAGLIEFVYPDKPNHPRQKYRRVKN